MFFTSQGIHGYESFLIAAVIFAMTPGLDTIFVLNKAFSKGRRAAVVGALGVNAGAMTCRIVTPGADLVEPEGIRPDLAVRDLGELGELWKRTQTGGTLDGI